MRLYTDLPGQVIPYSGKPPIFMPRRGWECRIWECEKCGVAVPAGFMPFPHNGCEPGTVVTSRFSWELRGQMVKACIEGAFA